MKPFNELKPQQRRRRMRRAGALARFIELCDRPMRLVPARETMQEKAVRLIEDVLERLRLFEIANLPRRYKQTMAYHWLRQDLEQKLIDARRELRISRGNF